MPEIKCPNCGTLFSIDEKEYDSILKTVKDAEFNKALNDRLALEHEKQIRDLKLTEEKAKAQSLEKVNNLEKEIESLKGQLKLKDSESELKIQKAVNDKEKEIDRLNNALLAQKNEEQVRLKDTAIFGCSYKPFAHCRSV